MVRMPTICHGMYFGDRKIFFQFTGLYSVSSGIVDRGLGPFGVSACASASPPCCLDPIKAFNCGTRML